MGCGSGAGLVASGGACVLVRLRKAVALARPNRGIARNEGTTLRGVSKHHVAPRIRRGAWWGSWRVCFMRFTLCGLVSATNAV